MSELPCRNPSCKSFGKPHPNCRCYGGFAEGGEARFCAADRPHEPGCEYFEDGGAVDEAPDFISDADMVPDPTEPEETATPPVISMEAPPAPAPAAAAGPTSAEIDAAPDFVSDADMAADGGAPGPTPEEFAAAPDFISDADMVPDSERYSTMGQQVLTGVEGLGQGILGPLAPFIEHDLTPTGIPGLTVKDQAARQAVNPLAHDVGEGVGMVGSAALGVGEAGLVDAGLSRVIPKAVTFWGKVGAGAVKSMLASAALQAGDETSKAMLGLGDPDAPVASALVNVGAAGLLGLGSGALGSATAAGTGRGLRVLAVKKVGGRLESWLGGLGVASQHAAGSDGRALQDDLVGREVRELGERYLDLDAYDAGKKFFDEGIKEHAVKSGKKLAQSAGAGVGAMFGPAGAIVGQNVAKVLEKPIGAIIGGVVTPAAKKVAVPAVLKMLSAGDTMGLLDVLNHAEHAAKGHALIMHSIDGLFRGLGAGSQQAVNDLADDKAKARLRDYIESGGIDSDVQQQIYQDNAAPEGFAEGGEVTPTPGAKPLVRGSGLAQHFPEQNLLLAAARGRVSHYLAGLQPPRHAPKLAFDDEPDHTDKKRAYDEALTVALDPLSVLREVGRGTIEPTHVAHLSGLYPEVKRQLDKRLTAKITEQQIEGKKPSYRVRQGLSLLLGAPLSSEISPAGIAAAQAVFARKGAGSGQGGAAPQKSTAALSKAGELAMTPTQAREQRQDRLT